jgi:ACS family hexuronate transporter-like MFS transporter
LVLVIVRWAETNGVSDTWRVPFRVIGSLGLVWVALWFLVVPKRLLTPLGADRTGSQSEAPFRAVFRDPRFWVLFVAVVAINVTWHGYRSWLPLYLQEQRGYTREEMSAFTTAYYLVADVGSWTVGLATLVLCRYGTSVHTSRVLMFGGCAALTLGTVAVPFLPGGWPLESGLLAVAFGALGLFPTYFALSQELSARHQGKVTGTLGAGAHLSLALIIPLEGWICDETRSYEWVLGGIGVCPLAALVLMLWLWPNGVKAPGEADVRTRAEG